MKKKNRTKGRKRIALVMAAALLATMLGGCQKTPEKLIVRQKGEDSISNYKEAEGTEQAEEGKEAKTEGETASAEQAGTLAWEGMSVSSENGLAKRLQVPERFVMEAESGDGKLQLGADAPVYVPDVEKVGVYQVQLREFTPELMEQVHQAFFGDAPIYEGNGYFATTKAEIQKKLDELKGYQAAGNLDPYGLIAAAREGGVEADVPDEQLYSLAGEIEGWEEAYQEAPETQEKVEVKPQFGLEVENVTDGWTDDMFYGAVETDEGVYACKYYKDHASDKLLVEYQKERDHGDNHPYSWSEGHYDGYVPAEESTALPREEAEKSTGISREEAIERANAYVEKLGDPGWTLAACRLGVHSYSENYYAPEESSVVYDDYGYVLYYTRQIEGFPTSYEYNEGGALESMDSTNDSMGYERMVMVLNGEGLQSLSLKNWCDVGEQQVENVELKPFPEIAEIYTQMMQVKFADMGEYMQHMDYQVKEVRLGYTRIYDPGQDIRQGLLVPVWDFFGVSGQTYVIEAGVEDSYEDGDPYHSFLTINAIDGTVIDRGLGY